jgi:hypothetical protein
MKGTILAAAAALCVAGTAPAAGQRPYERPDPAPDAAAQLAEMLTLYDEICLKAFPDDAAVARAVEARGGVAMTGAEVKSILHDDPGRGWHIAGKTAPFNLTVEAPPYHACGVRTNTIAGFPSMQPYQDLVARYGQGRTFQKVGPVNQEVGGNQSVGAGDMTMRGSLAEGLLVFTVQPLPANRAVSGDAIQVRFVHQLVDPRQAH